MTSKQATAAAKKLGKALLKEVESVILDELIAMLECAISNKDFVWIADE
ncbi:hypothetical protein [Listeria grandensis]|nr:hypothetical protein [Listeria grandensis]MBC6316526.1 hypothetical protein [Listeria grandensis]